jgi:hypothetical protein
MGTLAQQLPLQMVHVDLMGPFRVESIGSAWYLIVLYLFVKVQPLQTKAEAPAAVISVLYGWQTAARCQATAMEIRTRSS